MTKLPPDDDEPLVEFLHQHPPQVPPAAPDFEEQLMQVVASSPQLRTKRRHLWAVPPALVASVLIAWGGYRVFTPSTVAIDTASLEAFLENSWDGVMGDGAEAELPLIANLF